MRESLLRPDPKRIFGKQRCIRISLSLRAIRKLEAANRLTHPLREIILLQLLRETNDRDLSNE